MRPDKRKKSERKTEQSEGVESARDRHRYRQRERAGRESVAGEVRWREDRGNVPPERETFGVEEDKLKSKMGLRTRARRGKQNGEREAERKKI